MHNYYFNIHTLKNVIAKASASIHCIFEGDSYNEHELVAVIKNGPSEEPQINAELYNLQNTYFKNRLKIEKSYLYRFKTYLGKIIRKK